MVGDHACHHSGHLLRKTPEARLLYPRKLPRRPFAIEALKGHKRTHALQQRTSLFNHFLGAAEQREWESDARAIAFAMPLLQKADRVTVLTVIGGTEVSGPSAEQLVRNLRHNWIGAELKKAELDGRSTGETILATAQSLGCDLLIKGAYTQSR